MKKLSFFLPLLLVGLGFAEPSPTTPINFSGGLNLAVPATEIADSESPELCNCTPDLAGAMAKRNGSNRLINQSISSFPVTSLYRAYASTSTQSFKALFATSRDKIYVSTNDLNPQWIVISSNNAFGQHYSFVTMNRKVLIAGDAQTENVRQYDLVTASITQAFAIDNATSGINPRPKYQIVSKNFYIGANVSVATSVVFLQSNTTNYPSRIVYSRLNNPSSMTAQRFIDFKTEDGEEITGLGNMNDRVNVFKPSSILEISFTVLDLPSFGGDYNPQEVVTGFGCIAPRTLANTGQFYIFLAKDGIRMWDGGNRSRLTVAEESRIISYKIKPLIDDLIASGNYRNAVGIYYPKKEQYVFSFESQTRFPKGKNNYVLIYDIKTDTWWPVCNWLADSFATADSQGDTGQLFYGDSNDGYVHKADLDIETDDSRKEISLDVMDSTFSWTGSTATQNTVNVMEGTASLKMWVDAPLIANTATTSSMTRTGVFQFGEWYDKTKVTTSDKFAFKAFAANLSTITSFRIDMEVKPIASGFDTNFTSITFSSAAFTGGNNNWTSFEVPISCFISRPDWKDIAIESAPFSNPFNVFGIRFALSGVYFSSVSIDDVRIVQATDNPTRMTRTTKLFNFNTLAFKSMGTVLVTREKSPDAIFSMDIYNDFGQKLRTESFDADASKELVIFRPDNSPGLAVLSSVDFSVKVQTKTVVSHWDCMNGTFDGKLITCGDRTNNRLLAFSRANLSTFTMTYGSFGPGTSNFNLIHEISQGVDSFLISDLVNQRTKVHSLSNFGFIKQYGTLGTLTTSYHQPTGVCQDQSWYFVSNEANNQLFKMDQSTFGIVLSVPIDHNTNADTTLACDDKSVFMAYNKISDESDDTQNLFVDVRDKGDLSLSTRFRILPLNVSTGSYQIMGSISLQGKYIYIPFSNLEQATGSTMFYIQKRLKDTGDIVAQYGTDKRFLSAIAYSPSYLPLTKTESKNLKIEGRYMQLRFYDKDLDNSWKILNFVPLANIQPLTY